MKRNWIDWIGGKYLRLAPICIGVAVLLLDSPGKSEVGRAAELLSLAISIDTTNPPGAERSLADLFAAELAEAGLESRVVPTPGSHRAAVWGRLAGRGGLPPIILLSHLDVVAAEAADWSLPPFAGQIRDGWVTGRGALDAKGVAVTQLRALVELAKRPEPLLRDVLFLATPDEETGGREGAGWLVDAHPELLGGAEYLLTEGGGIRVSQDEPPVWSVTVTEKSPCWLELVASGRAAHSSAPQPDAAVPRLIAALDAVRRIETPVRVVEPVERMFRALAPIAPPEDRRHFANLAAGLAGDPGFRRRFLRNPGRNALVRDTISITVLEGGPQTNVAPSRATAQLDTRILPGGSCKVLRDQIANVIGDRDVEVSTLLAFESRASPIDTALFRAIEQTAADEDPDALVVPGVIAGFTDAHWFRSRGITAYGFVPRRLTAADSRGVHGVDERIAIANLEAGIATLVAILTKLDALDRAGAEPVSSP